MSDSTQSDRESILRRCGEAGAKAQASWRTAPSGYRGYLITRESPDCLSVFYRGEFICDARDIADAVGQIDRLELDFGDRHSEGA